jgi:transketolase
MRKIFIDELIVAAKKNKKIILVVNDLGYGVVEKFANLFPKQFVNAGVAEQNMMGLAAGLAMDNNHVFVYSIGNFPTFRCAEQIRNDVDYHSLPVTIVNVGSGISYGNLGYSHHSIQDYALMRTMPNLLIASPSNKEQVKKSMKYLLSNPQPSYLRLSKSKIEKNAEKNTETSSLKPGLWNCIHKGNSKNIILFTGDTHEKAKSILNDSNYKNYSLYSLTIWGMKYKKLQIQQAKRWKKILILEDHLQDGGFGSWFSEALAHSEVKIKIDHLYFKRSIIGQVGSSNFLNKKYFKKFEKINIEK